ncbi:helix-hairpin-helix motif protein [Rippkaea orientalis PCC 8801]|uniref:phospholipase D n=1 Tax=Rippkaea orientalis (strain PCC 8801 / RF-1) TaxID=41431 RepID=B7JV15_RIPO1|nr:DUF655 domain-containing protein [Rippkaea orientalis]ACK66867.1 helix-hairpin-helix motif protein [Rippkaea orientalis PCC 8801]
MQRSPWTQWISSLVLIVGLWGVSSCQSQANLERPKPLPQDPLIQVYFNHNQSQGSDYTEPYRNITRSGDNLEQILIDAIKAARSTIDIAVQEFRLPNVAKALVEQAKRGVKVRIILENTYTTPISQSAQQTIDNETEREAEKSEEYFAFVDVNQDGKLNSEEISDRDALVILNQAKIPVIDDRDDGSKGSGLMHHKFMVIDNKIVMTGSMNFTPSDVHGDVTNLETRGNDNNLLKINSAEIAQVFTEEFNLMWGDGVGGNFDSQFGVKKSMRSPQTLTVGNSRITVKFSPNSRQENWQNTSNGLIETTLNRATNSINLALFVFSEQTLVDDLEKKHDQGVEIRALIDPEFVFRSYSEGLDMLGVALSDNCRYEPNNKPWLNPIDTVGIPNIPDGDKLHHKMAVIDQTIVITGSHNWSEAANHQNDETLLIIENPTIAAHYQREFDRLYSTAQLGLPDFVQKKIQKDTDNCPTFSTRKSSRHTDEIINLNTATQAELESLPGIGEKTAQKIIEERQKKPFTSLDDLTRVSGIGEAKIKRLQGKVTW